VPLVSKRHRRFIASMKTRTSPLSHCPDKERYLMRRAPKQLIVRAYARLFKAFGPQSWWPAEGPFEVMVGAILTQNTAWGNVEKAIAELKKAKALSPEKMRRLNVSELERMVRPSGFYRIKAARLRNFLSYLDSRYAFDITLMAKRPARTIRNELLAVQGIGQETADSILLYALRKKYFVVDAYTKRIFSRHGVVRERDDYGTIQRVFMDSLPGRVRLYNEYHALIVRTGKMYCRKKGPRCNDCPLCGL